jgi:nicotinic acid mononucleotide adenylyltransferase
MINFKTYYKKTLTESAVDNTLKNHLSHLEDLAIEEGKVGFAKFVEQVENFTAYLEGFNSKTSVNLKVDGSPALFWGIDPRDKYDNQFFIATKTVFSKVPNLVHSEQEVDVLYKDAPVGLRDVLKTVFPYLKKGYDNSGLMYQGDLLFSPSRPPTTANIEGKQYVTFRPNLISYAVPVDAQSPLYQQVSKAPVGIVVHAAFNVNANGDAITSAMASRDTTRVVNSLKKAGVFAEGSNYKSLNVLIDPNLKNTVHKLLQDAKIKINAISNEFNEEYTGSALSADLRQYTNYMVRSGGGIFKAATAGENFDINKYLNGYLSYTKEKINKKAAAGSERVKANAQKKTENLINYLKQHKKSLNGLIGASYDMIRIKLIFQHLLANVEGKLQGMYSFIPVGDGYVSAPGEGHVLYVGDTPNQVKIVDRINFSANNFLYAGERGRKAAEQPVSEDAELTEKSYSIGIFGGGFNPPHIGHFEAAKMAAKENDDVYIIVSKTERDNANITLEKKLAVWKLYVPLLEQYRAKIHLVEAEVSPIRTTYEYVATLNESPDAGKIIVNLYSDAEDAGRFDNIAKYGEHLAGVIIRPTPRLGSGTEFRQFLQTGDARRAWALMPQGVDKNMVWNILTAQ